LREALPLSKLSGNQEIHMRHSIPSIAKLASVLAGAAFGVLLALPAGGSAASAAPLLAQPLGHEASPVTPARVYRRGRPPIYPYYYNPGRPGGYSFYFGFVPYAKGDYGTQALERSLYPQNIEWPPSMYPYGPRRGWGPKRSD
jgi:hypothetical protein